MPPPKAPVDVRGRLLDPQQQWDQADQAAELASYAARIVKARGAERQAITDELLAREKLKEARREAARHAEATSALLDEFAKAMPDEGELAAWIDRIHEVRQRERETETAARDARAAWVECRRAKRHAHAAVCALADDPEMPLFPRGGKGGTNGHQDAAAAAVVTLHTFLNDLIPGKDISKPGRALEEAGLMTVGDLLNRAAKGDRLIRSGGAFRGDTQLVYATLREVKGLPPSAVTAIVDAIVDAGLVPTSEDAPGDGNGEPQAKPPIDYWLSPCKLTVTLAAGGKVKVDWEPKTKTLTLDGPFGRAVRSPFERVEGATLQSCALTLAESLALSAKHPPRNGSQSAAVPSGRGRNGKGVGT